MSWEKTGLVMVAVQGPPAGMVSRAPLHWYWYMTAPAERILRPSTGLNDTSIYEVPEDR